MQRLDKIRPKYLPKINFMIWRKINLIINIVWRSITEAFFKEYLCIKKGHGLSSSPKLPSVLSLLLQNNWNKNLFFSDKDFPIQTRLIKFLDTFSTFWLNLPSLEHVPVTKDLEIAQPPKEFGQHPRKTAERK